MRTSLEVTEERLIAAAPQAVWSVVSSPAMHERLDPRSRVESTSGQDGEVSSEYVLVYRAGFVKYRMRYVIVDAEPGARLVAEVWRGGKKGGEQRAELVPTDGRTLLRWTVVMWVGPRMRRYAAASSGRRLSTWLDAVELEADRI